MDTVQNSLIPSVIDHHQNAMELTESGINVCKSSDIGISIYTEQPQYIEAVYIYVLFIMSRVNAV